MNLQHVRFVVERFSADFRMLRNGITTALKRSITNDSRFGCGSTNPKFMERLLLDAAMRLPHFLSPAARERTQVRKNLVTKGPITAIQYAS
jgi:hypothetical protein